MAGLPLTPEQAQALRDKGMLSPDTYNRIVPPAPEAVPTEPAPAPAPAPVAAPPVSDETARLFAADYKPKEPTAPIDPSRSANTASPEELDALAQRLKARDAGGNPDIQNADLKPGEPQPQVRLASDTVGPSVGPTMQDYLGSAMKEATHGYDMQAEGIRMSAQAGQAKAAEESAYIERLRKEDSDRTKALEASEAERKAKLDEHFAKMDEASSRLASQQVDPNRYWANKTSGEKVMAGIGLFLGAFGGGGNKAVAVIQNAIDQDIAAQKANIDTKKTEYQAKAGIYSDMLATFKDRRAAEEATRAAYLDNAQLKIKSLAAKYAGTEVAGRAETLLGEIEIKKQAARQSFAQAVMASMPVTPEQGTLNRIADPKDKETATAEMNQWQNAQTNKERIAQEFMEAKALGSPTFNNPYGSDDAYVKAMNARIFSYVKKAMAERFTDKDVEELVHPFQLTRADMTQGRSDTKMNGLIRLVENGVFTPTLDRYGMTPRSVKQKLGFEGGK